MTVQMGGLMIATYVFYIFLLFLDQVFPSPDFLFIISVVLFPSSLLAAATYFIKLTLPNLMALIHSRDITVGSINLVTMRPMIQEVIHPQCHPQ